MVCEQEAQKGHQSQQAEAQEGGYGGEAVLAGKV